MKDDFGLPIHLRSSERNEEARRPRIIVVFWDFIFQNQVIAKGIESELRYKTVILVRVVLPMRQNQRGIEFPLHTLEAILDLGALKREIPVAELKYVDRLVSNVGEKRRCAVPRLSRANIRRAKDGPADRKVGNLRREAEDRSAAADFDVVGMGTETEQSQRPRSV